MSERERERKVDRKVPATQVGLCSPPGFQVDVSIRLLRKLSLRATAADPDTGIDGGPHVAGHRVTVRPG